MKLIVGLGNPTTQYENTRHNAGFILLDEIQKKWSFSDFQLNKKFNAQISEGIKNDERIILVKPETFMNLSGDAVKALVQFYKISIVDVVIIHDDLDIELGAYKISADSSSAGHNGVQSIFDELGTQKIKRVRIGIEGAENKKERIIPGNVFVLQSFSEDELIKIKKVAQEIADKL
jgi:PTH1 family peptidyl-tRNA hydrolase